MTLGYKPKTDNKTDLAKILSPVDGRLQLEGEVHPQGSLSVFTGVGLVDEGVQEQEGVVEVVELINTPLREGTRVFEEEVEEGFSQEDLSRERKRP